MAFVALRVDAAKRIEEDPREADGIKASIMKVSSLDILSDDAELFLSMLPRTRWRTNILLGGLSLSM